MEAHIIHLKSESVWLIYPWTCSPSFTGSQEKCLSQCYVCYSLLRSLNKCPHLCCHSVFIVIWYFILNDNETTKQQQINFSMPCQSYCTMTLKTEIHILYVCGLIMVKSVCTDSNNKQRGIDSDLNSGRF